MNRKGFEVFLTEKGYVHSTTADYSSRIVRVCRYEGTDDWDSLAENINMLLKQYDKGGAKEKLGSQSHNAVISALRCFDEYSKRKVACE